MKNIYSTPEAFGLRTVAEVEFSSGSYEFDLTVVWQDTETRNLYYADDAGCSCPVPFEAHDRSTITKIGRLQDLLNHLEERKRETHRYDPTFEWNRQDVAEIDGACASLVQAYRKAAS